jgi:hypothetical protein
MKTLKTLVSTCASITAMALLTPAVSMAEVNQTAAPSSTGAHSLVHRVSHSLADSESYTSNGPSGYKWGRKIDQDNPRAEWAETTATRGSYKWGNSSAAKPAAQAYAGTTSYQWGVRSYAEQAGYRWGLKNLADQTGYRWGLKNFADQTGYRWGLK